MTHRTDRASESAATAAVSVARGSRLFVASSAVAAVAVVVSSALVVASLVLTSLALAGAADWLPAGLRAATVCVVALTLPGLPIAAFLRLPFNGIFASVTIAVSLSVNILLAQTNFAFGPHKPFLFQFLLLAGTAVLTALLARRSFARENGGELLSAMVRLDVQRMLTRNRGVTIGLLVVAIVLFLSAVARMKTEDAESFGLLQILGLDYFAGLGLLSVVLAIEYRRLKIDRFMLAAANVVLIVFVTMPVAWADRTAPFGTAYVHAFITNWMVDLGTLPPPLDARISWAGFFSAAAQLTTVGGLRESDAFIVDASLVFGVLMIFPVYAIGLAISKKPKAAWLGVTVYVLFNWYQQDYFAPQAVAMQFYATLLAVLLWQLRAAPIPALDGGRLKRFATAWRRIPGRVAHRDARWTFAMELVLLLIIAAQVVTHQLTPVATIFALILFAALGASRYKVMWLAAILMFVAWFTYGAYAFWAGHLGEVITDIGGVDQNFSSGVAGPVSSDPTYGRMQYLRIAAAVVLFASAGIGWLRLPKSGLKPILLALSFAPFVIVLLQSYGGEVVIRCFLYASPVLAPLAALVLLPLLDGPVGGRWRHWTCGVAAVLVFFTLGVWLVTDRGLNTSFEHSTEQEVAISQQIVDQMEQPAEIAFWGQGAMYGLAKPFELGAECLFSSEGIAECTANSAPDYFIYTDQDENYMQFQLGVAPETARRAVDILLSEKGFEMIYDGRDIKVLKRIDAPDLNVGPGR